MKKKTSNCKHGWHDGSCCCNCINLVEINCHPMNKTVGEGSILKRLGYGCKAKYGDEPKNEVQTVIFSEKLHGMCELHFRNPKPMK